MRCGVPLSEIADAAGLAHITLRQTRLEPGRSGYRSPPENWPALLAGVARRRTADLDACSADLTALADELDAVDS